MHKLALALSNTEYIANYCKLGLRCKFCLETKTKGADHSTNAFGKV